MTWTVRVTEEGRQREIGVAANSPLRAIRSALRFLEPPAGDIVVVTAKLDHSDCLVTLRGI
jgi:hypothetical protein